MSAYDPKRTWPLFQRPGLNEDVASSQPSFSARSMIPYQSSFDSILGSISHVCRTSGCGLVCAIVPPLFFPLGFMEPGVAQRVEFLGWTAAMPIFTFLVVAAYALIALLFVADA